jgi:hypothetical protein
MEKFLPLVLMGVWQVVAMVSLKFHLGSLCPPFYALWAGHN